jgi:biotin synthase
MLMGVEYIRYHLKIPVSILIAPPIVDREYLERLKYSGVDAIGVAIDTATQELFNRYRTPLRWESYWEIFREAVDTFGKNRVGAHLIVGLGETEREMVEAIQKVRELGGKTHLFSFYPENGSALEGMRPCEAGRFRRIQLARYLIDNDMITLDDISFDEKERIAGFNFDVDKIISSGKPFMTSGCRGCNRPYGDSTPGDIRSYPFVLSERDVEIVREQIWDYGRGGNFDKINYTL